ncbi:Photosystem I reaction center subunit II, chloroplastic [Glycine soja]|nr:Photosystem I reaction center subunit II, chloroplastic [Glycine soja]
METILHPLLLHLEAPQVLANNQSSSHRPDHRGPSPIFGGSTGGLLRKAQVEEFYVITWDSPKEQIFEMPTGGAAIMREGPNLLKLARKEQCLALGTRLRSKYKIKYQFYRVFPNGEVQYLHPKDGVYPEKVNAGRQGVGQNFRSIGKNVSPIEVKFTGKQPYDLKEQCLALGTRLRSKYKIKYQFYRVFPNGEVQYLHPKDGVYPEKVNAGRQGVGQNFRSIGKNVSPIEVKFTGKQPYDL